MAIPFQGLTMPPQSIFRSICDKGPPMLPTKDGKLSKNGSDGCGEGEEVDSQVGWLVA